MNQKYTMDLDTRISMNAIKTALKSNQGVYGPGYTSYLADRLDDELSPREFIQKGNEVIREMIDGQSSDQTKPVPFSVHVYAKNVGSFLLTDFGIALSQTYCPPEFAKAVRVLHKETFLE